MPLESSVTFGIDLGGTSTRVGLYDGAMRLLGSRTMATPVKAGPTTFVAATAQAIESILAENSPVRAGDVLGIGVGSPGPINLRDGVLGLLPNLPGWENFPLRNALADATGMAVLLESDANAAAIAEWKLGAGKAAGVDSMAMLTLGTGVGSGLILGGRVWHGMFGMGGEVGHASIDPEGLLCACGTRGCLEMYASANGLRRMVESLARRDGCSSGLRELVEHPDGFTPNDVAMLAETQNDASARAAFARLGQYLGIGIANLINVLDLPMIVVGGGVAGAWNLFAPAMFQAVREYSVVYRLVAPSQTDLREPDRTFIRPALLGAAAGLIGAALLPLLSKQAAAEPALAELV